MLQQGLLNSFIQESPLPIGVLEILENDLYYHHVNPAAASIHGLSFEQMIGRLASEINIEPQILTEWMNLCHEVLKTRRPVTFKTTFNSQGTVYLLDGVLNQLGQSEVTGRPLVGFTINSFQDSALAEKNEIKKIEKDNELQFQILANSMNQLAWMADAQGWVYWFNHRWFEYTGTTPAQMQGWGWSQSHHPDHIERIEKRWREALKDGKPIEISFPLKAKNGEFRWFLTRVESVRNADGQIVRWFGTSTDVHDKTLLEEKIKKTEERLSMAIENARVGFYDWEVHSNTMIFSERMLLDWGITSADECVTLEDAFKFIHPDDRPRVKYQIDMAMENKTSYHTEYRVVHPDGKIRWMDVHGTVRYNEKDEPIRFFGTSTDITSRKEAEALIINRKKELRAYIEGMPQMAFMADPAGNITYYNSRHYQYFGVKPGETENWAWLHTEIHHKDDYQRTIETWKSSLESGSLYEIKYRLRRHDGEYRWHLGRAFPIRDDNGKIIRWVGTNTDIHEHSH